MQCGILGPKYRCPPVLRHHALPARLGGWRVLDQVSGANDVTPVVDVLSMLWLMEGIAACIGLSSCSRGCRLK